MSKPFKAIQLARLRELRFVVIEHLSVNIAGRYVAYAFDGHMSRHVTVSFGERSAVLQFSCYGRARIRVLQPVLNCGHEFTLNFKPGQVVRLWLAEPEHPQPT